MSGHTVDVTVAGHICLDVLPTFSSGETNGPLLAPGRLVNVGPAVLALGGAVANTGCALHRLGINTRLMGKIGDDLFGRAVLDLVHSSGEPLAQGMIVTPGEQTSYSVVISPPEMDRIFLHHPGVNDRFGAADINLEQACQTRLFHLGYPPLMRQMYQDGGVAFAALLRTLKQQGVTTSLDMALPDPASEAGQVDWQSWLARVLPYVDIFLPSVEELLFMLHYPDRSQGFDGRRLSKLADHLLQLGAAIVVLKLGNDGLYLRTTPNPLRLNDIRVIAPQQMQTWQQRELLIPCFQVQVVGTTGAGDCTIAGFLAGLLHNLPAEEVLKSAVAVGASSVEQADATSGVPSWLHVQNRLQAGWNLRSMSLELPDWQEDKAQGIWQGPNERKNRADKDLSSGVTSD